jgi:hypothetical protein
MFCYVLLPCVGKASYETRFVGSLEGTRTKFLALAEGSLARMLDISGYDSAIFSQQRSNMIKHHGRSNKWGQDPDNLPYPQ